MNKIILLISFILLACLQKDKPFFDFDEVYHYQTTENESRLYSERNPDTPQLEKDEYKKITYSSNYPKSLNDNWFLERVEKYFPKKQKIDNRKLNELSEIFTERKEKKTIFSACVPIYRNIFIFKKNGKVVGISKICFGCLEEHTIGTRRNTENFGSHDEYEKLKKIIQ
ncbi:hypothetical protein [Flavobacterium suncheonense]|uniref:Lipoprotein n=1 Tax=Flavobacterium suncheonense GH29-5 = DSM 17707 TaxID=1121899 RepID=A0A0A2M5J3_9FLAO|nr:hypothetical protein [Flavobacterium suncheonense]KGO86683.1 hypothetical protein Q764_13495 [Flavobacterium suncheonense GH29-5 = DSM 17707]